MSWVPLGAAPPHSLGPVQQMHELRSYYEKQTMRTVLQSSLGLDSFSGSTGHNAALTDHTVVIGIDTEAWTRNTNEMTEIGLAVYERKDMVNVQEAVKLWRNPYSVYANETDPLGPFGEELLRKISFYHLRIVENAHLKTDAKWMKGAEGNRFGHSRFVTFAEARAILDMLFNQPIISDNPALAGCKKPIILLGHAISHDRTNCKDNGLDYDWFKHGTIVKEIDTQPLAKATRTWFDAAAPNNDVGLEKLTRTLGYEHMDPHTACNDAARTLIAAIQMVLPKECRDGYRKNMQAVALDLEIYSRSTQAPSWGTVFYCTRCGGRDHDNKDGSRCAVPVHCNACAQYDGMLNKENSMQGFRTFEEVEEEHWETHIEECCQHVADFKAWQRRCNDAKRKRRPLPPGPPEGTHPPSGEYVVYETVPHPIVDPKSTPSARVIMYQSSGRRRRGHRSSTTQRANPWDVDWRHNDEGRVNKR